MIRLAAIDIGSNAIRLLIKSTKGLTGTYHPEVRPELDYFVREPIRLGLDVYSQGIILPEREHLLTEACKRFRVIMMAFHVSAYRACATAAFRAASNGVEVAQRVKEATGIHIDIISGEEEAQLVQKSYFAQVPGETANLLFADVGGGSTDVILVVNGQTRYTHSFPVGSIRMICRSADQAQLRDLSRQLSLLADRYSPLHVVGSGGSIHKLAQLFPEEGSNNIVRKTSLETLCRSLEGLTVEQKMEKYHLQRDRAEIIAESSSIFLHILNATHCEAIEAPRIGVRDGIIADLMQRMALQDAGL